MKKLRILLVLFFLLAAVTAAFVYVNSTKSAPSANPSPSPTTTPAPSPTLTPTPAPSQGILPQLQIHYIDVGQGDSILIDLGQTEVLIDGGDRSPGVASYLRQYVDGPLEVVVATHPDADHIGGLIAVLDAFKVEKIILNGDNATSQTYGDFMTRVNAESAEVKVVRRGDTIVSGNLTLRVLSPIVPLTQDTNENSIVLMLSYGKEDFLFMGDAGREAEAGMIAGNVLQHSEILKVGHHGSSSATSQAFLNIAQPEVAVYMAGIGNQYGHPHPETISALQAIGAQIYGTDTCGTITVTTDGNSYTVSTAKKCATTTTTLTPRPTATSPSTITVPKSTSSCIGATAICNDGTCSYSQHRSGTCSNHDGAREWINLPPN